MIFTTYHSSPMGDLQLVARDHALIGLWLEGQKYRPAKGDSAAVEKADLPFFAEIKEWLDRYFAGEKPNIQELTLAPEGSAFRQDVWQRLCAIPYGEVTTYGALARDIAESRGLKRMSAQAVGGAVGHNPISIIIPCHRVVGTKGNLTGYGGGIDQKIRLLAHEGLDMDQFYVPKKGTAL